MDPTTTSKLLLFVSLVAAPFLLGWLFGRMLKLRDVGGKIGIVLLTAFLGAYPFLDTVFIEHKPLSEAFSWGIDLAGGTNLVYQTEKAPKDAAVMDRMVQAIRRRIDPSGTQELAIRQVGKDQIEVIIPGENPEVINRYKSLMTRIGSLEFDLLANERDHKRTIAQAQSISGDLIRDGKLVAGWRPIAPKTSKDASGKTVETPNNEFGMANEIAVRQIKGKPDGFLEVLVIIDPDPNKRVTGQYLTNAAPEMDESGHPAVGFTFNTRGAHLFSQLTGNNKPLKDDFHRRLAIVLDEKVYSAPQINTTIGGRGIIQGNFTSAEVNDLVSVLNAGALEVGLKPDPVSEFTISPLLGADVQRKGKTSMIVATIAVFALMAGYYLIPGVVADLCLLLNVFLLLGIMSLIDATFTLPGMAGIVLGLGMSVDANVLINERFREELNRGSSLRMTIKHGYSRAFAPIFDSNVVTLLSAAIMYMVGSDQVKGFGVTLFIGVALSMYTALYVSHLTFDILERKRWIKGLKMFSFFGETHFDFVGTQYICTAASTLLIVAGLAVFAIRGQSNYDIDFTGGTMVTMQFVNEQPVDEVREKLEKAFNTDITVEKLTRSGETDPNRRFRMRTTDQDQNLVIEKINQTFGDELVHVTMQFGKIAAVPAAAEGAKAEEVAGKALPPEKQFAGGHEVDLTFSSTVAAGAMDRHVAEQLAKITNDKNEAKYGTTDQALSLFAIKGSAADTAEPELPGTVKYYENFKLYADKSISEEDLQKSLLAMQTTLKNTPLFDEVNNFESSVAAQALQAAILAVLASIVVIVAYVWYTFQNVIFGVATVVALVHDVLAVLACVTLGAFLDTHTPIGQFLMLNDFKINLTMVAAFLSVVGFSLNDKIIIFDRLREIRGKNPAITRDMVNLSINQTLSRTMITSGLVLISVIVLYVLGGEGIHGFAYAMLMGTIIATYSSIYVSSPIVLWIANRKTVKAAKAQALAPTVAKTAR